MHLRSAMEEELQCPVCHKLFVEPVILPCTHNLCFECAETLKSKSGNICDISPDYFASNGLEFDKVSLLSETVFSDADSGYSGGSIGSNHSDQSRTPSLSSFGGVSVHGNHTQPPSPISSYPKGVHLPSLPESISCLTCPICQRTVFLDDRGVDGLTRNTLMLNIIKKFEGRERINSQNSKQVANNPIQERTECQLSRENTHEVNDNNRNASDNRNPTSKKITENGIKSSADNPAHECDMCEENSVDSVYVKCDQCGVVYCQSCRDRFHPSRGPLATHTLRNANLGPPKFNSSRVRQNSETNCLPGNDVTRDMVNRPPTKRSQSVPPPEKSQNASNGINLSPCSFHVMENMSMFCEGCQTPLCYQCLEDGRHRSHDVKAIGATYKSHKADLSQQMSALSNKARHAKDLVMHLRYVQEEIQKNSVDFEARTIAQCNALMEAINQKKQELIQRVNAEKEVKSKMVREQLQQCTMKLKQTTGLLEYCIEVMKDNDPAPFLQVSSGLIRRVSATEQQWTEHHLAPRVKSEFDLDLDATALLQAIENFTLKQRRVPDKPIIKIGECSSKNNTVTLSWGGSAATPIDAFILELDDGARGNFRDVYRGKETMCTVDGLHFNSIYRARVSAFNRTGQSLHSDIVQLQTSEVAMFYMDPTQAHPDIKLSKNCRSVNCTTTENRVVLGSIGFSKGTHYWEYSVDRYDSSNPDVVFGVAQREVGKSCILGKDRYAWAMYIDNSRTWFLHNNHHTDRYDGGVDVGSRLGVLLEIEKNQVTFYVNQKQRGKPVVLEDHPDEAQVGRRLARVFYPALSLNRQAQVTLWSGLRSPVQIKPPLHHSQSFNGPASSNPRKMVGNHGIMTNMGNSNSVPRCTSKKPSSPTLTLEEKRRSQSSNDLKNQNQSNQRLYHSLPSQPVVRMNGNSAHVGQNRGNTERLEPSSQPGKAKSEEKVDVKTDISTKPAVMRKPPQLVNAVQQARGRQLGRQASCKTPPPPPVRRGSNSSLSTVSTSTKSTDSDNLSMKTFQ